MTGASREPPAYERRRLVCWNNKRVQTREALQYLTLGKYSRSTYERIRDGVFASLGSELVFCLVDATRCVFLCTEMFRERVPIIEMKPTSVPLVFVRPSLSCLYSGFRFRDSIF